MNLNKDAILSTIKQYQYKLSNYQNKGFPSRFRDVIDPIISDLGLPKTEFNRAKLNLIVLSYVVDGEGFGLFERINDFLRSK